MFERFTDSARQSIVGSQREAWSRNRAAVEEEDLLLSVLDQQDPVVTSALDAYGVDVEAVRRCVDESCGADGEPPSGHIPFSPQVKKALELSLRESLELGDNHIGPVHLVLGVVYEGSKEAWGYCVT